MTRLFLKAFNAPILILLTIIGIAIQTSLFDFWPLTHLQPNLVLIITVWCALRREVTEGGIITLILADVAEIHSAAPMGVYMITYMLSFLTIRVLSRYILIAGLTPLVGFTLFVTIFWKISGLGVLELLGSVDPPWGHTLVYLPWTATVNGFVAFWVFKSLDRFDWITYKHPKADQDEGESNLLHGEEDI